MSRLLSRFAVGLALAVPLSACDTSPSSEPGATEANIRAATSLVGLGFTDAEVAQLLEDQQFFPDLADLIQSYAGIRAAPLTQDDVPAFHFRPGPLSWDPDAVTASPRWTNHGAVRRPADLEEVAYWPVGRLAELVRTRQVTSLELTNLYLERLERFDPDVEAVVLLLPERARAQAARVDQEIDDGRYRGPLHGIPYGLKDLFALEGHPTTWGAAPRQDTHMEGTATVARRLEEAGAVLVAKLSLGALAWGDVWFGGNTKNPWNLEEGSSGSSAGSGAAVSAGLVPFAIGTETLGSIISPSTRTGVTGLRPTYGRVSRAHSMAVSWTMDKAGPMCRNVEDCAMVFDAIRGPDGIDLSVEDHPFAYRPDVDVATLRIGYLEADFGQDYPGADADLAVLDVLRELGADVVPISYPERTLEPLMIILGAEAAASFEDYTLDGLDDRLTRQITDAWPNVLRTSRLIPAADYIQANRIRSQLGRDMRDLFQDVDVYVAPSTYGNNLLLTNLTGHPAISVPNGFTDPDSPKSIVFVGRLFDEATLLAAAKAYQDATDWHTRHPERFVP